jgi:autophagy-related protein 13
MIHGLAFLQDRMPTSSPHVRRPSINSIHPFKSATVSSSPSSHSMSLRHNSPLSAQGPPPSPFISAPGASTVRSTTGSQAATEKPTSGLSGASGASVTSGDGTATVAAVAVQDTSKRYSSSFKHRHAPIGGGGITTGSDGSGGSVGREAAGSPGAGRPNIAVEPPTRQTTGDAVSDRSPVFPLFRL